MLSAPRGG